jgi:hypothetical protein
MGKKYHGVKQSPGLLIGCATQGVMSYLPFATNCGGRGVFRTDPRLLVGERKNFFLENLTFVRYNKAYISFGKCLQCVVRNAIIKPCKRNCITD